ncbi:MAG: amidohydrolase family protein [Deltaproteobacteria bacterium]|nr:amidohydrolase family protein [Deltaproteobacteria bacterium]
MIIDAEVHLISPEITKEMGMRPGREPFLRRAILTHPDGKKALKLATTGALIRSMDQNRIGSSLIMGLPFCDDALNQQNNRYIYESCRRYPDRLYGLGIVNLVNKKKSRDAVQRFKNDYGFLGVKVIPAWQGVSLSSKVFFSFAECLVKNKMLLLPHVSYVLGAPQGDGPADLFALIKRHPELKVLAPHLGGLLCFHYTYGPVKKYFNNVRFITSVPESMRLVGLASQVLEPHHLVFGTDFPFQPDHSQGAVIKKFEALKLDKGLNKKIYAGNFKSFIGT